MVAEYGDTDAYQSVLRYVRVQFLQPEMCEYRRVEEGPPGPQVQIIWAEYTCLEVGEGPRLLHLLWMTLLLIR